MKITFLGTGTSIGVPVIGCDCRVCQSSDCHDQRLRSSILWEIGDTTLLVDAGPDFRQQMLRSRCRKIDGILITHEHYDHVGGLDDVRGLNYTMGCSVTIYAENHTAEAIRKNLSYVFTANKYPGVPQLLLNEIDENRFYINNIEITPIRVLHYKLPILGYRIGDCAYITDASFIPDSSMGLLQGCKTLIINALRHHEHMSHFTLKQAIDVINTIKPQCAYLTHMSHEIGLHAEVQPTLPPNVYLGYDGLEIEC